MITIFDGLTIIIEKDNGEFVASALEEMEVISSERCTREDGAVSGLLQNLKKIGLSRIA